MDQVLTGETSHDRVKAESVLAWIAPVFLSFVAFLLSFPIYRQIPFWPHLNIAEFFALWFLFVMPVTVAISIIKFVKYSKVGQGSRMSKLLLLAAIILSALANIFVLLGLWAAFYY